MRRIGNAFEYPGAATPGPSADDVEEAIAVATRARQAAATIPGQKLLRPW